MIARKSKAEHYRHVEQVFQRLKHYGLKINPERYTFVVPSLTFHGHVIDENGLTPIPEKVEDIKSFPQTTKHRQLRRFLKLIIIIIIENSFRTALKS